jgi:hypothetical protein
MGLFESARMELKQTPVNRATKEVFDEAYKLYTEGWKHTHPSPIEIALGYAAYYHWKFNGESYTGDPYHFSVPNDSARKLALLVISQARLSTSLRDAIRRFHNDFDPEIELTLASQRASRSHPVWGECVTRSAILICRSLAYADRNLQSEPLRFMQNFAQDGYLELGRALSGPALGEEATTILFGEE